MNYLEIRSRKEYWLDELSDIPNYLKNRDKKINNVINFAVAGVCAFLIRPPLFLYPLIFVALDIVCTGINIFAYRILPNYSPRHKSVKKLEKENKRLKALVEKYQSKLERRLSSKKEYKYRECLEYHQKKLKRNEESLDFYRAEEYEKARKEEEKLSVNKIYETLGEEKMTQYTAVIQQLGSYVDKMAGQEENVIVNLTPLVNSMRKLFKSLGEKPENINYLNSTFNVYGTELINILKSVERMDEEEQAKYKDKLSELVNEYVDYLDRLEDKIQEDALFETDININVLMNELRKDKERS